MGYLLQNQDLNGLGRQGHLSSVESSAESLILSLNKNPKLRPGTVNVTAPLRGGSAAGVWCPERRRDLQSRFFSTLAERRSSLFADRLRHRAEGLGLSLDYRGALNLNIGEADDTNLQGFGVVLVRGVSKTRRVLSLRTAYSQTSRLPSLQ